MRAARIAIVAALVVAWRLAGAQPSTPAPAPAPAPGAPAAPTAAPAPAPTAGSGSDTDPDDMLDPTELPHQDPGEPEVDETSGRSPVTGTGRLGVYADSDNTTVWRALVSAAKRFGAWSLGGSMSVDAVSSASIDVRSAPSESGVDVVSSASGISSLSGPQMTDTRYQATVTGGWTDDSGHVANATAAFATENDYTSASGGVNGSIDLLDRTTTLLGGVTVTDNWVGSQLDRTLHHKMLALGWSAGIARVLTPDDAIRLRYDGRLADGYQASPYRYVRFGDWTTTYGDYGQLVFLHTIGSPDGAPEALPEVRVSHAATLEWVHSLARGIGLHPSVRVAHDSWGISSVTPGVELRVARGGWRLLLGYRFYAQTHASFYETRYEQDPAMYRYYTSDKELGREVGHLGEAELDTTLMDPDGPGDTRMLWYLRVDVMHYRYPGFALMSVRTGAFIESGLTWEL